MRHLNRADGWLRQSLEGRPDDSLTRLHFARVRMLRSASDSTARELMEVARSQDAAIGYLACLFAGAVHGRRNRLDDAAAAYRCAIG